MAKNNIVITLFTIIYGLMLTDLFFSFHKLVRHRKNVKWHWLPLLAAWYLFLIILKNWWDLAFFSGRTDWMNIYFFIAYGHLLLLIFLSVSTVLPDDIRQNGIDLKAYYFKNHRYFWGLMSSIIFVLLLIGVMKQVHEGADFTVDTYINIIGLSFFILLTITLSISKKFWIHSTILTLLVVEVIIEIAGK